MNKIKITEQDVNRKFKTRDGRIFRIVRFVVGHGYYSVLALVTDEYASVDCKNAITLTDEGSYNAFTAGSSQYDFKEWADEDEKMGSKIELKVGQKVKFRNGEKGVVKSKIDNVPRFEFSVEHLSDNKECYYTLDGYFYKDKTTSTYDVVEILEEAEEKGMEENLKENKGKFELSITVNDINNSCKNDKYYFTGSLDLSKDIRNLSFGNNVLYQILPNIGVLSSKNDTFKFSKIIKLNDKELGKVTIRVTQLRD